MEETTLMALRGEVRHQRYKNSLILLFFVQHFFALRVKLIYWGDLRAVPRRYA